MRTTLARRRRLVGVREALQLQRCIVFFVLDGSGTVLVRSMQQRTRVAATYTRALRHAANMMHACLLQAQVTRCFVTNGLIYLGR